MSDGRPHAPGCADGRQSVTSMGAMDARPLLPAAQVRDSSPGDGITVEAQPERARSSRGGW